MEEKQVIETEEQEILEVQNTFNTDTLEVLVDGEDCTIENKEEVNEDANENK